MGGFGVANAGLRFLAEHNPVIFYTLASIMAIILIFLLVYLWRSVSKW